MPTVTIYRAVKGDELDDINNTGAFNIPTGNVEGKYFCDNMVDISRYARLAFSFFPFEGEYTAASGEMSTGLRQGIPLIYVDGGIGAIVVENFALSLVTNPLIYNYMVIPDR